MTDKDLDRLPKWAQNHIRHLEEECAALRRTIDGAFRGEGRIARQVLADGGFSDQVVADDRDTINFYVDPDSESPPDLRREISVRFGWCLGNQRDWRRLEIRSVEPLVVLPKTSNAIDVFPERIA